MVFGREREFWTYTLWYGTNAESVGKSDTLEKIWRGNGTCSRTVHARRLMTAHEACAETKCSDSVGHDNSVMVLYSQV